MNVGWKKNTKIQNISHVDSNVRGFNNKKKKGKEHHWNRR